ncbi:MAG: deoxyribonuclease IV [Acidobacteriia bacterium]|nr:deoxyribonuclease IV [Terriglobia bacterium]
MRIGIHTSISGSLEKAALKAAELGANTFQIFSASPRMWRASMPAKEEIAALRRVRDRLDLRPLAIHTNYLINLASLDPVIRERSVTAFRGELERADAIGTEYLVTHPGNYRGQPVEQGLAAFVLGLAEAASGRIAPNVTVLLENTAGSGAQIGCRLEELQMIRELAARETDLKVGYCLDTCHLLAAGFDVASEAGLQAAVSEADSILGIENVKVIHANDSKGPLGSHMDRHANIGEGHIGREGFRRILAHPKLRTKAFILETPNEEEGDDRRNVEMLKSLSQAKRALTRRAKPGSRSGASRTSVS